MANRLSNTRYHDYLPMIVDQYILYGRVAWCYVISGTIPPDYITEI